MKPPHPDVRSVQSDMKGSVLGCCNVPLPPQLLSHPLFIDSMKMDLRFFFQLFSKLLALIMTHTAIKYNHILSLVTQQHFSYIYIAPLSILSYKVRYGGNRVFYPFSNVAAIALNVLYLHCPGRQKLAPSGVRAFDACSCSKLRFSISIKCTSYFREFRCQDS